jgi:hypothetical protein
MAVRFMTTLCLVAAILGSMIIASGNGNAFFWVMTIICWIYVVIGALWPKQ